MRIVGGARRGTALAGLGRGDPAARLRPTSDRVRESLFNILCQGRHGDLVTGARVLDLFAGTGALGLEALSRGADSATFMDNGRAALSLIRRNIALCRFEDRAEVLARDATRPGPGRPHDLIFLDPPYGKGLGVRALQAAHAAGWIADGATVIWEEGEAPEMPPWLSLLDQRRYGGTTITMGRTDASA